MVSPLVSIESSGQARAARGVALGIPCCGRSSAITEDIFRGSSPVCPLLQTKKWVNGQLG